MEIVHEKKKMNIVTEVSVFAIVFGGIMALLAYFALTGMKNAPDLVGVKRNIALGTPLATLAVIFFLSGILLITTRAKAAAVFVLLGGLMFGALYFIFEVSTIGFFGANLMSIVAYGIPVTIIVRAWNAMQYLSGNSESEI